MVPPECSRYSENSACVTGFKIVTYLDFTNQRILEVNRVLDYRMAICMILAPLKSESHT